MAAAPKFVSFKKVLAKLAAAGKAGDAEAATIAARTQLVSFHSTSKGFIGECGLRCGALPVASIRAPLR